MLIHDKTGIANGTCRCKRQLYKPYCRYILVSFVTLYCMDRSCYFIFIGFFRALSHMDDNL